MTTPVYKDGPGQCCCGCPTDCTACGDEFDLVLVFAAPFDFIHINGAAMLSYGSCAWSLSGSYSSGTAFAILDASLYCEDGKWYLSVEGCFTTNGSDWQSCSWLSAGVAGSCPPTGTYTLTETQAGCTVSITTSRILAPD